MIWDINNHPHYHQGCHIPSPNFEGAGPFSRPSAPMLQTREQVRDGSHYHVPCQDDDGNDAHVLHGDGPRPSGLEPHNDYAFEGRTKAPPPRDYAFEGVGGGFFGAPYNPLNVVSRQIKNHTTAILVGLCRNGMWWLLEGAKAYFGLGRRQRGW